MIWICERDYQPSIFDLKSCFWFTLFQILLCGFNGMEALTSLGQWVSLLIIFFGITVLSLAIAVVFNTISLSANESWALDWLREYTLKEKERNAATDYLAYWWKYLTVKGASDLPPDEHRRLQSQYYSSSVTMFNKMSGTTGELAQTSSFGVDRAFEDATVNALLIGQLKSKLTGQTAKSGGKGQQVGSGNMQTQVVKLTNKIDKMEEDANRCLDILNDL